MSRQNVSASRVSLSTVNMQFWLVEELWISENVASMESKNLPPVPLNPWSKFCFPSSPPFPRSPFMYIKIPPVCLHTLISRLNNSCSFHCFSLGVAGPQTLPSGAFLGWLQIIFSSLSSHNLTGLHLLHSLTLLSQKCPVPDHTQLSLCPSNGPQYGLDHTFLRTGIPAQVLESSLPPWRVREKWTEILPLLHVSSKSHYLVYNLNFLF